METFFPHREIRHPFGRIASPADAKKQNRDLFPFDLQFFSRAGQSDRSGHRLHFEIFIRLKIDEAHLRGGLFGVPRFVGIVVLLIPIIREIAHRPGIRSVGEGEVDLGSGNLEEIIGIVEIIEGFGFVEGIIFEIDPLITLGEHFFFGN